MKYSALIAATAPLLMGSCMLGPDFESPSADVNSEWIQTDASMASQAKVNKEWWKQFNDKDLNRIVTLARGQNLNLRTAALRILEARALLGISQGNFFPQNQALSGDLLRVRPEGGGPDQNISSSSFGFDAAWELDFWGKFRRDIESADANVLAELASYDDLLVSLTAEVANVYVNIRTVEERIALAQQNAELQTNSLEIVELQFEAGTVTELDVLQAKTLLSTTQSQIPRLQASLHKFHNALSTLIGKPPGATKSLIKANRGIPEVPLSVAIGVPAELLRRRPDIRQAEMRAMAQSPRIGIARSDLFPSFTLIGSLGTSSNNSGDNQLGDLFSGDNVGFTFGPTFRWNILNYGRIKNNVRVQDARFEQTITNYQSTVLNAAREVEDGMTGFIHAKIEAEYLKIGVDSSQRSSELSMLQYKEGLTDYQRVLDSIRSLTQRQDQYASVRGTIATNLIATYKALGGGWETVNREQSIPQEVRDKMRARTNWGKVLKGTSSEG